MREFHDGRSDGLKSLEPLDLENVKSFSDLLRGMSKTAFSGRQLGHALDILVEMVKDEGCQVVLTISGAMTIGKMGKVVCQMIDRGMVQAIIATGALMTHGLSEAIGLVHYEYDPTQDDKDLYDKGYNRVYDTLEMESNLNDVQLVLHKILEQLAGEELSSAKICRQIGRHLSEHTREPGILKSAYEKDVPVYVPAFTDCELGLDTSIWNLKRYLDKNPGASLKDVFQQVPRYNPFHDLQHYAELIGRSARRGIFTVGGGVPRNWAQQVGPYYDLLGYRLGLDTPKVQFHYGIRICPEPVHWGGLSGCTYSEGVSWGKFVAPENGGRFSEVFADATIAWPLLIKAAMELL